MARLIETRIAGLNNGLTNSVLLARAEDLQQSPWLPRFLMRSSPTPAPRPRRGESLDCAVKTPDLRPLALRLACITLPVLLLGGVFSRASPTAGTSFSSPTASCRRSAR